MNGVNANEGWLFVPFPYVKDAYDVEVGYLVGVEHVESVMKEYPVPDPKSPVDYQNTLALIFTDMFFNCPNRNSSDSIASYKAKNSNSNGSSPFRLGLPPFFPFPPSPFFFKRQVRLKRGI